MKYIPDFSLKSWLGKTKKLLSKIQLSERFFFITSFMAVLIGVSSYSAYLSSKAIKPTTEPKTIGAIVGIEKPTNIPTPTAEETTKKSNPTQFPTDTPTPTNTSNNQLSDSNEKQPLTGEPGQNNRNNDYKASTSIPAPTPTSNLTPTPSPSPTPTLIPTVTPTPTPTLDNRPLEASLLTEYELEGEMWKITGTVTANKPLKLCQFDIGGKGLYITGGGTINGNTCTRGGGTSGNKPFVSVTVIAQSGETKELYDQKF